MYVFMCVCMYVGLCVCETYMARPRMQYRVRGGRGCRGLHCRRCRRSRRGRRGRVQRRQGAHDLGGCEHADVRVRLEQPARRHRHVGRAHRRTAARRCRHACHARHARRDDSAARDRHLGLGRDVARGHPHRARARALRAPPNVRDKANGTLAPFVYNLRHIRLRPRPRAIYTPVGSLVTIQQRIQTIIIIK